MRIKDGFKIGYGAFIGAFFGYLTLDIIKCGLKKTVGEKEEKQDEQNIRFYHDC